MKTRPCQQLFAYWNDLRGNRLAPRRFEVEPSAISAILPDTFILEREDRFEYPFRLAGTRICDRFGREFRGRNLLAVWSQPDREVVVRVLETVTRDGGVGRISFTAASAGGLAEDFELLLLPLVHTGQAISRVMGAIAPLDGGLAIPIEPYVTLTLGQFDTIWPDGRPHAVIARSEAPAPFIKDHGNAKVIRLERRSFRVYQGGLSEVGPDGSK